MYDNDDARLLCLGQPNYGPRSGQAGQNTGPGEAYKACRSPCYRDTTLWNPEVRCWESTVSGQLTTAVLATGSTFGVCLLAVIDTDHITHAPCNDVH